MLNFFKRLFGISTSIPIATSSQIQELLDKSWVVEETNELFDGTYAEYYDVSLGTINEQEFTLLKKEKL